MRLRSFLGQDYVKLAILVIVIGAALRFGLAALSHPAGDSCWHLSVSRFIAENGRIPLFEPFGITDREVFSAPPLFHIVAALVYKILGWFGSPAADFGVKLVSAFFGSLTLPFVFLLGRKLHNARIGFFALFFVAFLPLHINSSVVSFVDSLAALLATVAIYFLVNRRIFVAAFFAGLGLLAKQTMVFLLPVFFIALFFIYKNQLKSFFAKSAVSAVIISALGLPWLIRNYLLLGNPVWPFLYKVFGGRIVPEAIGTFSIAYLFSLRNLAGFYLELAGAPLGSLSAVSFVSLPFMGLLLSLWLALTVLFFLPVVLGISGRQQKRRLLVYGTIISFLVATIIYVMNTGSVSARFFLPSVAMVGIAWAVGIDSIFRKAVNVRLFNIKAAAVLILLLLASAFAFSAVESAKTIVGAKAWSAYQPDFDWVKENTKEGSLIAYRGQCLSYNINRPSDFNLAKADYVWVNQQFKVEPVSILEPDLIKQVQENFTAVYNNSATGTVVYKRQQ